MNNGYQQFFNKAKENAKNNSAKSVDLPKANHSQRVNARKRKPISKKKAILPIGFLFLMLAGGFLYIDEVDQFLSRLEISFFNKAFAEDSQAKTPEDKSTESKANDSKTDTSPNTDGNKETNAKNGSANIENAVSENKDNSGEANSKASSDADLNHFARLTERKKELDLREVEIKKMEEEIVKQREELEKKMTELENMRRKISSVLEEKVQVDDKRVENLVQFYSSMKPQQAAKIIENIDEGLAVEVLARMKKKSAAEIMNLLKPEKAQVISEKYTGYRK